MMQRRSGGCWNAFGRIPKHSNVSKNADSEIFGGKAEHIPSLFFSIKKKTERKAFWNDTNHTGTQSKVKDTASSKSGTQTTSSKSQREKV